MPPKRKTNEQGRKDLLEFIHEFRMAEKAKDLSDINSGKFVSDINDLVWEPAKKTETDN